MTVRLIILGAGGFAAAVAEAALLDGTAQVIGCVDDRYPDAAPVLGLPVLGRLDSLPMLRDRADAVVPAIGAAATRRAACQQALAAGFTLHAVVHPRAWVSPSAQIGPGATVMAGATVGTGAVVGRAAIINAGAVLDHHVRVGDYALVSVGACAGGGAILDPESVLGPGAVIAAGQRIGKLG